jgi:hypothetical protein
MQTATETIPANCKLHRANARGMRLTTKRQFSNAARSKLKQISGNLETFK